MIKMRKIWIVLCVMLLCFTSCGSKNVAGSIGSTSHWKEEPTYVNVVFYNYTGEVIKTDTIPQGASVIQPPENATADGYVFTGWDKSLTDIQEDTCFYPLYSDIREGDNVVFSSSAYFAPEETISLSVQVGGNVSFASMELQVTFDHSLLKFESVSDVDPDGVCYYDEKSETIYFAMASAQNINAEVDLFTIQLSVKSQVPEHAELLLEIHDIAAFDNQNELITTSGSTINGNIFLN